MDQTSRKKNMIIVSAPTLCDLGKGLRYLSLSRVSCKMGRFCFRRLP